MHRIRIHQGDIKGLKVDVVVKPLVSERKNEVSQNTEHSRRDEK